MATIKIEQLHDEFWITTYFDDGFTSPQVWNKTFKTRKGAEKCLNNFLKMQERLKNER